jgi:hypothetical protein
MDTGDGNKIIEMNHSIERKEELKKYQMVLTKD